MNELREYKKSPFGLILNAIIFTVLFFVLAPLWLQLNWFILLLVAGMLGLSLWVSIYSATTKIILSNDEISTRTLLGTKTLRWGEINRISGRGYGIKLHNLDGDVTIAPSPNLPKYEEVVEMIGLKRPDLFAAMEYNEMSRSWIRMLLLPVLGFIAIGFGGFLFLQSPDNLSAALILLVIAIVLFALTLFSPQKVTLEGNTLVLGYLLNQKTLPVNELASVGLGYTRTRYGKNYFVTLNLRNKKVIRLSGLGPNVPVTYLVLKNWYAKNTASGQTNWPN